MSDLKQAQVFTPPHITNQMIDLLDQSLLSRKDTFFFEPTCGDGEMLVVICERIYKSLFELYKDNEKALSETIFKFYATELDAELVIKARMKIFKWAMEKLNREASTFEQSLIALQIAQAIENRDALKDSIPNIDPSPSMRALKRKRV